MRIVVGLLTLFSAACSSASASPPGNAIDTAPTSAASDGADAADAAVDAPCAAPAITFARSPVAIDPPRDHHFTMVREVAGAPYLYVMGGEQDDFSKVLSDVQRAKIGEDGALGAFEPAGAIPAGIAGSGFAVVGDDVVLFGGVEGPRGTFTDVIQSARFGADGTLTGWKKGPSTLPQRVMHSSAVAVGRDVYVFGGTTGSSASTLAGKVTVNEDGSLSPYVEERHLATPRSHQAAVVAQGGVYLIGGLDEGPQSNPPSRTDVVRAAFQSDGTLGHWTAVGKIENPVSISAAQQVGCSILLIGGLDDTTGGPYSDRILRGSLRADGTFRTEKALDAKVSVARGHVHQTPVYKGFMYSVGGRANDGSMLGTIDIGTIARP